ncbi:MAG: hemolysin III family protein [Fusobacterium sp.]|nr:hemolysin III family protein [Fusobacterium sp.]
MNLLVIGGVVYTVGAVFYSLKRIRFTHAIWHLFVIGGSVLNYLSVYNIINL